MAYKDKDKQREAQRKWVRQKRAAKGSTVVRVDIKDGIATTVTAKLHKDKTMTITQLSQEPTTEPNGEYLLTKPKGITQNEREAPKGITEPRVLPCSVKGVLIPRADGVIPKRGKDTKCLVTSEGIAGMTDTKRRYCGLGEGEWHRVTGKPGDADYNGICTPEWIKERRGVAS